MRGRRGVAGGGGGWWGDGGGGAEVVLELVAVGGAEVDAGGVATQHWIGRLGMGLGIGMLGDGSAREDASLAVAATSAPWSDIHISIQRAKSLRKNQGFDTTYICYKWSYSLHLRKNAARIQPFVKRLNTSSSKETAIIINYKNCQSSRHKDS